VTIREETTKREETGTKERKRQTKSRQEDLPRESTCSWDRRQPPLAEACPRWEDDGHAGSKKTEVKTKRKRIKEYQWKTKGRSQDTYGSRRSRSRRTSLRRTPDDLGPEKEEIKKR